jgi:hypothetical protein
MDINPANSTQVMSSEELFQFHTALQDSRHLAFIVQQGLQAAVLPRKSFLPRNIKIKSADEGH